jgi:hypothetical protein
MKQIVFWRGSRDRISLLLLAMRAKTSGLFAASRRLAAALRFRHGRLFKKEGRVAPAPSREETPTSSINLWQDSRFVICCH